MTARVLVVDDIAANSRLLEARLTADYFDVIVVDNGPDALDVCAQDRCDIVLLDVMMPGMDGFEVCRRIKSNVKTAHLPVIMVTALDQPSDKAQGLDAGADDFLTKPVNDLALISRVKSLVRLKMLTDELHARAASSDSANMESLLSLERFEGSSRGRILHVEEREAAQEQVATILAREHIVDQELNPDDALFRAANHEYELIIISLALEKYDPLRLCSQLRSMDRTRMLPILTVGSPDDNQMILRGLELGVNDYLLRPIESAELLARARTQIRRKRFTDALRNSIQQTMELAVIDPLTKLYNRRYLESQLSNLVDQAERRRRSLSIMILDIDKFKNINDTFGHHGGDQILCEFSGRIRENVRGIDLTCRLGGEEFVVIMPDTDMVTANQIADRICEKIAQSPFKLTGNDRQVPVTVSIGVSEFIHGDTTLEFLKRADSALYQAKNSGRNRVVSIAA